LRSKTICIVATAMALALLSSTILLGSDIQRIRETQASSVLSAARAVARAPAGDVPSSLPKDVVKALNRAKGTPMYDIMVNKLKYSRFAMAEVVTPAEQKVLARFEGTPFHEVLLRKLAFKSRPGATGSVRCQALFKISTEEEKAIVSRVAPDVLNYLESQRGKDAYYLALSKLRYARPVIANAGPAKMKATGKFGHPQYVRFMDYLMKETNLYPAVLAGPKRPTVQ
jgi:hypothetical protein